MSAGVTNPVSTVNSLPIEPELRDLLDLVTRRIFLNLNCHHLATVQSFNSTNQTVQATINYPKTFRRIDPTTQQYANVQVAYPLFINVPVVILGGGNAYLTMPIIKGDQCLLLFNDRSIDNWFQSGQVSPLSNPRAHSLSDGIALIGLNFLTSATATKLSSYDGVRAVLRNGTAGVGVNTDKVQVFNSMGTLNTVMQDILTQLETLAQQCALLTVTCAAPGNPSTVPINAANFTAVSTQLTTLATTLGGLLE